MPYDRFCDIHVPSGSSYHFTSEIVDYCKYQLETKGLNCVPGKSLIVLDYISDWEHPAKALLQSFEKAEVVLNGSAADAARKFQELFKVLKPPTGWGLMKIAIPASGGFKTMMTKLCSDYAPLEPLQDPASFKGPGFVTDVVTGGFSISKPGYKKDGHKIVIGGGRNLDLLDAQIGYLGISVPMADISSGVTDSAIKKMIEWIVTGGSSKLRFNAHGDGAGNLQMAENIERVGLMNKTVSADCVATWLVANGLRQAGGLKTISVNICMAARHNLTPAILTNGRYSPAEGSAVSQLASKLGEANVHNIKVTGSNDVIDSRVTEGAARTPAHGELKENQPFRKVSIPHPFEFDKSTFILTVPKAWTITDNRTKDSRLFIIRPPSNWTARVVSGDFVFEGDGRSYTVKNAGWIVDINRKEVLSSEGWSLVDGHRIQFVGTGGASVLEELQGQFTILERLAKSRAKAVAYS